jgi:tRNA(fMet)-specific endonuclease VapC
VGVIFDTGLLIALERGNVEPSALIKGREDEPFGISAMTAAELLHGVHRADTEDRKLRRQAFVEKVLEICPTYPFDTSAARIYAALWSSHSAQGKRIGAHDLIIASTAIALGFTLITSDRRDYQRIEGLLLEIV